MSRPATRTPFCKDCLEEARKTPNRRIGTTSYCGEHAYKRQKKRKTTAEIRYALEGITSASSAADAKWTMVHLESLKRKNKLPYYDDVRDDIALELEAEAADLLERMNSQHFRTRTEQQHYRDRAYESLFKAAFVKLERLPTLVEQNEIRAEADNPFPPMQEIEQKAAARVREVPRAAPPYDPETSPGTYDPGMAKLLAEDWETVEEQTKQAVRERPDLATICTCGNNCTPGRGCLYVPTEEVKQEAVGRDLDRSWGPG